MSQNIKTSKNSQRGIIKYVFYIFIIILILSYLGFDLKSFMESDQTQSNLSYVWSFVLDIWKNYLKPIYDFLANWFGPYISETLNGLQNHNYNAMAHVPDIVPKN